MGFFYDVNVYNQSIISSSDNPLISTSLPTKKSSIKSLIANSFAFSSPTSFDYQSSNLPDISLFITPLFS